MSRADRRARKQANKTAARKQQYEDWRRARRRRRLTGVIVIAVVALLGATLFTFLVDDDETATTDPASDETAAEGCTQDVPDSASGDRPTYESPPEMVIDTDTIYVATMETSCGTIVAELDPSDPEVSPDGVNNFVFLARDGFYDGTTFHRVVSDFVIQGGDPEGTGTGGPGYSWGGPDDVPEGITYEEGDLAYANSAGPETSGSQFFVVTGQTEPLDAVATYIKFGRVVEGLDVAKRIEGLEVEGTQAPSQDVYLVSVIIEER